MSLQMTLLAETSYNVQPIPPDHTHWFLLNVHYAKRVPSISHAFGLYWASDLVGVITYGVPASHELCKGVAGPENAKRVLELNRLALLYNKPNEASRLIAGSLKLLPAPKIVVSYADTAQRHTGKVYQATNWLYTGLSDRHAEWRIDGQPNTTHDRHRFDAFGGLDGALEHYGNRLQKHERSRKHRYVFFVGNKAQKKLFRQQLRYSVKPYPQHLGGNTK
jgi:hypothetical protein